MGGGIIVVDDIIDKVTVDRDDKTVVITDDARDDTTLLT